MIINLEVFFRTKTGQVKKISDEEFAIKNTAKLALLDFFREGELYLQRY